MCIESKLNQDEKIARITVLLALKDIEPNKGQIEGLPKNPREVKKEDFELLKKNITDYPEMLGYRSLMVYPLDNGKYVTIGGNMRLRALRELGYKEAPCVVVDKDTSPEQLQAYTILDNASFGQWDWDLIANEWDTELLEGWGLDLPVADLEEEQPEAEEDNFDETEEEIETRVKFGDVWQLGTHRLMCGDSTKREDVEKLMHGDKANMVFTDPPYGMKKEKDGVLNDNFNKNDLLAFYEKWIPLSFEFSTDNAAWYCWGIDPFLFYVYVLIIDPLVEARKMTFRNYIIWVKPDCPGRNSSEMKKYPPTTEKCLFLTKGAACLSDNQFRKKEYFFDGFDTIRTYMVKELQKSGLTRKQVIEATNTYASHYFAQSEWAFPTEEHYKKIQELAKGAAFQKEYTELQKEYTELLPYFDNTQGGTDVWEFSKTTQKEREGLDHATPKPIKLCQHGVKASSREGALVLDLFGGSGSTLIACEQLNRRCYMMEYEAYYCDVIIARWEKLTGQKAVKIER